MRSPPNARVYEILPWGPWGTRTVPSSRCGPGSIRSFLAVLLGPGGHAFQHVQSSTQPRLEGPLAGCWGSLPCICSSLVFASRTPATSASLNPDLCPLNSAREGQPGGCLWWGTVGGLTSRFPPSSSQPPQLAALCQPRSGPPTAVGQSRKSPWWC